jgi:anti-sigma B factor antagonist
MTKPEAALSVRQVSDLVSVIDVGGEITAAADEPLMAAYAQASGPRTRSIVLNFDKMTYMNSSGIGLLVTLLVRVRKHKQQLFACGLSAHYRQIFDLTRLDEAIQLCATEADALAAAQDDRVTR